MKTLRSDNETANEGPKVKGKAFSKAVTENRPRLWDDGLEFDGSMIPVVFQKTLLKDWLTSERSFEEICHTHGLTEQETRSLKAKLTQSAIALKELQTQNFELAGREAGDEAGRQAILVILSDGIRLSRHLRVMAEMEFLDGQMTPDSLVKLVNSWDKILRGVGKFLTTEELNKEKGFRLIMDMTRSELKDLKDKVADYRSFKLEVQEAEVVLDGTEEEGGDTRDIDPEEQGEF